MKSNDGVASAAATSSFLAPPPSVVAGGDGEEHSGSGEWRAVPTNNPLKLRLSKVARKQTRKDLHQPPRDSGTRDGARPVSTSTSSKQSCQQTEVLDAIDRHNRRILAKKGVFRMFERRRAAATASPSSGRRKERRSIRGNRP